MDLRLSNDPYESFKIFQGRILDQYLAMTKEFNFVIIDANEAVEKQQVIVRKLVSDRIDLKRFKRRSLLPLPPSLRSRRQEPERGGVGKGGGQDGMNNSTHRFYGHGIPHVEFGRTGGSFNRG